MTAGFVPLFDGSTVDGWHAAPRVYGTVYPGGPHVHELFAQRGMEPPKPDWPADTGIMIRRQRDNWAGFQVLLDHRESGGIGGFFGNWATYVWALRWSLDASVGKRRQRATSAARLLGTIQESRPVIVHPIGRYMVSVQ